MRSFLNALSYLAIWPALYVAAAVICLAHIAGLDLHSSRAATGIGLAFCTALATYLLDRIKLKDAWLDPADAAAHPARFHFLAQHTAVIRGLAVLALAAAIALATRLTIWAPALPLLASLGVLAYAARPRARRPRPKDLLLIKNTYVAAGIAGFAVLIALAIQGPSPFTPPHLAGAATPALAFSAVQLFARIFADAALCDLDDESADRRYGTVTLPTRLGRMPAWNVAMCLRIGVAMALLMVPLGPPRARMAWAALTAASTFSLRIISPAHVRDMVDLRFVCEAALAAAILALA